MHLNVNAVKNIRICCDFKECPSDTVDTIPVVFYYGWNCDSFPVSLLDPSVICKLDSVVINVLPQNSTTIVEGDLIAPTHYSLCKPFEVITYYQATGGVVYPKSFNIDALPPGLSLVGVEMLGHDSIYHVPLAYNQGTHNYPITTAQLNAVHDSDLYMDINEPLYFKLLFVATCAYSGQATLPDWNFNATNYCGDTIQYTAGNRIMSFTWDGTSFCDSCITVTKTASSNYVSTFEPVTFTIHIETNNQNPSVVNVYEYLPVDFQLTSSSITLNPLASIFVGHQPMSAQGQANITVTGYYLNPGGCSLTNNHVAVVLPPTNKTVTADACLTVYHPCADTTATIITDSTFSSSLDSTSYQSRKFFIDGTLFVDNPLTLTNCSVHVAPGGAIMITRDASLILNNTNIMGCDTMWQGIQLDTIAHFEANNNSRIQDAQFGVTSGLKSTITLQDANLKNNVVGLYYPPLDSGTYSGKLIVNGTNFSSAGSFKPDYLNQPMHGAFPFAGIEINDALAIQIGVVGGNQNHFERLNSGIVCRRSIVKVSNSNFENIKEDAAYVNPSFKIHFGDAVHGEGDFAAKRPNFLTVNDNLGPITYNNCEKGIFTYYSDLIANHNTMTDMRTGIESTVCADLLRTVVRDNSIAASNYGIYWHGNAGSRIMSAQNNTITMTGAVGQGVSLNEKSDKDSANYIVGPGNQITINGSRAAIHARNVYLPLIALNNITMNYGTNNSANIDGILIEGCDKARVIENNVLGDNAMITDTSTTSISTRLSSNGAIICNTTVNSGFGFFFGSLNPGTQFKGNSIYDHFDGLRLNNVAVIDSQAHGGNMWLGNYQSGFGAVNFNDSSTFTLRKSLFTVDPNSSLPGIITTVPDNTLPPPYFINDDGWFRFELGGNTFECASSDPADLLLGSDYGSDQLRLAIAQELNLTNEYIEESKTIAKEYLMQYLIEHPSALTNPIYADFANNNENQNRLNETSERIAKMREFEESTKTSLLGNYELIQLLVDSLNSLRELNEIQPIINYQSIVEQLTQQLLNVKLFNENLLLQANILQQSNYSQASIANGGVITTEVPQENSRFVNEVALQYELQGVQAIINYYPALEVLANQCPYQGGKAVLQARYYVSLINDSLEYNDDLNCLMAGIWRASNAAVTKELKMSISPNPTKGDFKILFNNPVNDEFIVSIINNTGQIVSESKIKIEGSEVSVNITSLVNGIYQFKIKGKNTGVFNGGITLIK